MNKKICLSGVVTKNAFNEIITELKTKKSITDLIIYEGVKIDNFWSSIADALKVNESLFSFQVSYSFYEIEKKVIEALKSNTELKVFSLLGCQLNFYCDAAIVDLLKVNKTLTVLGISSNYIGPNNGEAIGNALKVNNSLSVINLSSTKIMGKGGKAIGDALKVNKSLNTVLLSMCSIENEGAIAIADALKVNTSLTILDISNNLIFGLGGKAIGNALKINSSLTNLWLNTNFVGSEGAKAIGNGMKKNTALKNLDLSYNSIFDEGAKVILDAYNSNLGLIEILFNGNNCDGNIFDDIMEINHQRNSITLCADYKFNENWFLSKEYVTVHLCSLSLSQIPNILKRISNSDIVTKYILQDIKNVQSHPDILLAFRRIHSFKILNCNFF